MPLMLLGNTLGADAAIAAVIQLGLSVALVLFFVWQADKRERRMANSNEALATFIRTDLKQLAERSATAIEEQCGALEALRNELRLHAGPPPMPRVNRERP